MINFLKLELGNIFVSDYQTLSINNAIEFTEDDEICVIYGPNGVGKTSFVKVLAGIAGSTLEFEVNGKTYSNGKEFFHIINDQNDRNIIKGETKDFFLGENIRREFELNSLISSQKAELVNQIKDILKNFGIKAANSPLFELVIDKDVLPIIKDIANAKSSGEKTAVDKLVSCLSSISLFSVGDYSNEKLNFLMSDYSSKESIIKAIETMKEKLFIHSPHIHEIEENTEAISILNRFQKDQCIVCDTNGIDRIALLTRKENNRSKILEKLDPQLKELIQKIINLAPNVDPYDIKTRLLTTLQSGETTVLIELLTEIEEYKKIFEKLLYNSLSGTIKDSDLEKNLTEFNQILAEKPELTDEDILYIQEIISNSMNKEITLTRGQNNNLQIKLGDQEFLGITRDNLPLSTGEQNFLSLSFEFLKAKASNCPYIVIDDPISSFDSIYKNKIVYAIIRMLQGKKKILLTHNIDLIRLMDGQKTNCFKLFLINNTEGEVNGFIPLSPEEQGMLINLEKLLIAFREKIFQFITDKESFLISMIPFMRGYSKLVGNKELSNQLTNLMHGYKKDKVDIGQIYITLFGNKDSCIPNFEVTVDKILCHKIRKEGILETTKYPLLDRTLQHSFTYLYLRLLVEKALVNKFQINTKKYYQLGQIIIQAYPNSKNKNDNTIRARLSSKKTLLNEFNHFEGNLSIFQPAIDITNSALEKEKADLEKFVRALGN